MKTRLANWVLLAVGAVLVVPAAPGCGSDEGGLLESSEQSVVYGSDDRQECDGTQSVALMDRSRLDETDPANIIVSERNLGAYYDLCPGERFADQPVAGFCSGTLIDDDLVLTAGHCVDRKSCRNMRFVFHYAWNDGIGLETITANDVFRCKEIVAKEYTATVDYAIVRLDRQAIGHLPQPVSADPVALATGTPLRVMGYPSGLPCKVDEGGAVRDGRAQQLDYFVANLDTFGGNSGSGVYQISSGALVGVLVRGETDYVYDSANQCYRVNVCPDDGCSGEDSTYAFRAIEGLCRANPFEALCRSLATCGDGACEGAHRGENCQTCPEDCPAMFRGDKLVACCGNGKCEKSETNGTCPVDCK